MNAVGWGRVGAVCGLAWPVLVTVAFGLVTGAQAVPTSRRPSAAELRALQTPGPQAWFGEALYVLGALAFLAFAVRLWATLRRVEREPGWLATLALCASIVYVAAKFPQHAAVQAMWAGADPTTAWVFSDQLLYLSLCPLAVALVAASTVILEDGGLPRWLGWLGIPVAAGLVAATVSGNFDLAMPVIGWVAAAGIALLREHPTAVVAEETGTGAPVG